MLLLLKEHFDVKKLLSKAFLVKMDEWMIIDNSV